MRVFQVHIHVHVYYVHVHFKYMHVHVYIRKYMTCILTYVCVHRSGTPLYIYLLSCEVFSAHDHVPIVL